MRRRHEGRAISPKLFRVISTARCARSEELAAPIGFDLIKASLPSPVGTLLACISSSISAVIQVTEYNLLNHN